MKSFFQYVTWLVAGRVVKQKMRSGSLAGLALYIKLVSGVRKGAMFSVLGIMGLAAITVGFFMLVGGLLWLANLNPIAYPWIMVVTGALLTLGGVVGFIFAFREKMWVEMSKAPEMIQAAVSKFPANERPMNPAVSGLWSLAADVRIREHSRMEQQFSAPAPTPAANTAVVPPMVAPAASITTPSAPTMSNTRVAQPEPQVSTPVASAPTASRPAPSYNPSMKPAHT